MLLIRREKAASMDSRKALQGAVWKPGRNWKYGEGPCVVAFTREGTGERTN